MNSYRFENFYMNTNNKRAFLAAQEAAQRPGETYNPLYIYGGTQTGKTHLLYSIESYIKDHFPEKKVVRVTAEDFINDCINAIRTECSVPTKIEEFRNKYRNADVLLFDDIDYLNGKHSTQDEFLHTFNCLYEAGKQIVMTGKMSPRKLVGHMEENIASRLGWGVTVEIPESSYNPEPLAEEGQKRIELLNKRVQNLETELKKEKQRNIELEIIMKKLRGQLALASCTLSEASQE